MPHRTWKANSNTTSANPTAMATTDLGTEGRFKRRTGSEASYARRPQSGHEVPPTGWSQTKQYRTIPAYAPTSGK